MSLLKARRLLVALPGVPGDLPLAEPDGFSSVVGFPPHVHFVHEAEPFHLGIGVTLLLVLIWAGGLAVALAGYLVGGAAHTVSHVVDATGAAARPRPGWSACRPAWPWSRWWPGSADRVEV